MHMLHKRIQCCKLMQHIVMYLVDFPAESRQKSCRRAALRLTGCFIAIHLYKRFLSDDAKNGVYAINLHTQPHIHSIYESFSSTMPTGRTVPEMYRDVQIWYTNILYKKTLLS